MEKLLKEAIANILFNLLWKNLESIEELSSINATKEFRIISSLDKFVKEEITYQNYSIDYDIMVINCWNKLYYGTKEVNKEYSKFIDLIKHEFVIDAPDDFMLIGTLDKHEKYIKQKLDKEYKEKYDNYLKQARELILDFKLTFLNYYNADITDQFLNRKEIINSDNIKYTSIKIDTQTAYLDQNIIEKVMKSEKLKKCFLKLKDSKKISFIYSPHLIEDSINMNPIYLKEYISFLEELTDCQMAVTENDEVIFVKENIIDTYNRVKKYKELRELYEKQLFSKVLIEYYSYPNMRKNEKFYNEVIKDLIKFFKRDDKKSFNEFEILKHKFCNTSIDSFVNNGTISNISSKEFINVIEDLIKLLDFVNFETEKINFSNMSKIFSSYRDNQHIIYSHNSNFLITNDQHLKKRAETIFLIINCNTKVFNENEFLNHINLYT